MGRNSLMGSLMVSVLGVSAFACTGQVSDDVKGTAIVGEQAELVARKREWLSNYGDDCNVCFKAFELCELGAQGDQATLDACEAAMNACVEGGLIQGGGDEDGGVSEDGDSGDGANEDGSVDDGDTGEDVDGGVSEDGNNGGGEEDGEDGDVGDGEVDDGDVGDGEVGDGDVGDGEAGDGEAGDGEDDNNGGGGNGDLVDDVRACLDEARACLDGDADARQCIRDLKGCVKDVLRGAFESVCEGQRRECRDRNVPDEVIESVEGLCEEGLPNGG